MAPFTHPKLAILWLILTVAQLVLTKLLYRRSALIFYIAPCLAQNLAQWYFVFHTHYWHQFYIGWWVVEFIGYFIALSLMLYYSFDCMRYSPSLPKSLTWQASLLAGSVVTIYLLLRWYDVIPYGSRLATVDQACQLLLAVIAWIVATCCHFFPFDERNRDILKGFVVMYTVGVIATSLPFGERYWFTNMSLQLSVILWWLFVQLLLRSSDRDSLIRRSSM